MEFDIEKALGALDSIEHHAKMAADALKNADSNTCADHLNKIEDELAVVRDNAPGLCW